MSRLPTQLDCSDSSGSWNSWILPLRNVVNNLPLRKLLLLLLRLLLLCSFPCSYFSLTWLLSHHPTTLLQTKRRGLQESYGTQLRFIPIPQTEPVHRNAIRVTMRAGSMVIWDQCTVHGSTPNNSSRPRYAQFIKLFPVAGYGDHVGRFERRVAAIQRELAGKHAKGLRLSKLGRRLFGLDPWPTEAVESPKSTAASKKKDQPNCKKKDKPTER